MFTIFFTICHIGTPLYYRIEHSFIATNFTHKINTFVLTSLQKRISVYPIFLKEPGNM